MQVDSRTRCKSRSTILGVLPKFPIVFCFCCTAGSAHQSWSELSKLNEPANNPSKLAALAATQGMTRKQIRDKHFKLVRLYRQASAQANGTALQILKREIHLLYLAGAD